MPVRTACTVPVGITRSACGRHQKPAAIAITVAVPQPSRRNPSDHFSSTTQTTSNTPAAASRSQGAVSPYATRSSFCATTVSAICTAFSAAPLRRLSDTHQNDSPCSTVGSLRMRLTNTASSPAQSIGVM